MPIPKSIFQTWKTKEINHIVLKQLQDSWKIHNPSYEYTLWDDEENRDFIEKYYPDFLSIYDGYDVNIKRVDAVRYFYLYHYGGIYADLDFECLKSFDVFTEKENYDIIFGTLGNMDSEMWALHDLPNALMISKSGCDFFKFVIDTLKNIGNQSNIGPEISTGPILLKFCISYYITKNYDREFITKVYGKDIFENVKCDFSSKFFIENPEVFYPINWDNKEHVKYRTRHLEHTEAIEMFPDSHAVTYWMHSW